MTPTDLQLHVDPDRIHQVLANLTANALQFGPADRPVRLTAASDGEQVVLAVSDEGPGIPDAEADQVFARFYRASAPGDEEPRTGGFGVTEVATMMALTAVVLGLFVLAQWWP
ncbi:MAG: sensor histidine kinase [Iamia sp.]